MEYAKHYRILNDCCLIDDFKPAVGLIVDFINSYDVQDNILIKYPLWVNTQFIRLCHVEPVSDEEYSKLLS